MERGGQALALLTGARLGEAAGLRHVTLPGLSPGNPTCSGVQGGAEGAVEI